MNVLRLWILILGNKDFASVFYFRRIETYMFTGCVTYFSGHFHSTFESRLSSARAAVPVIPCAASEELMLTEAMREFHLDEPKIFFRGIGIQESHNCI